MITEAMRSYQAQASAFAAAIPEIKAVFASIQTLLAGTLYISQSMKEQALVGLVPIRHWLDAEDEIPGMTHDVATMMQSLQDFRLHHETLCANANEHFINAELERYSGFFDTVEKNPLTQLQRRAVVIHDDNTLVVAGAGAGKTSVILAKTGYLLKKNLVTPGTILLLAYNANAARQMSDRIRERLGVDVTASTFHSLGLSIITKVEGRKPSVSVLSDDELKLRQWIQDCIGSLVEDEKHRLLVLEYFQEFFAPYKNPFDFKELGEYYQYVKTNELRTLRGNLCKSYEECEISNYLYLNGIEYEYERPYPVDLATADHRQYTPDFYLPRLDVYLEHLAIREDGTTPKFIDQQRYLESVEWKRQVHKQHGTILWETYTYQKTHGTLIKSLESRLREHGAEFRPLPAGEALQALNRQGKISNLSRLIAEFLRHYKGGCLSLNDLRNRTGKKEVSEKRLLAFLGIFEPVFERYQEHLRNKGELDFEDMIAKAARYAEASRFAAPYQCILVDEFQDISRGRSRLIQALLGQQTGRKLFCVGDDWQAIYRFAGSDISLMREFSTEFGSGTTVVLDKTFRFNNQIENTASRFIMKNPGQIKKSLDTVEKVEGARVFIHWTQKENTSVLRKVVMNIAQDWQTKNIGRLGTVM
ncbi:MAG TPA: UvrD-helicase domain-containing protein, partial [Spirochaetota bacterium]|nr:UvrD-helicase domain-containing protein [Spirochaetota bacterium]